MTTSVVKSAERALAVLQLLARTDRPMTTVEVARAGNMPKSSAHHLLNVMRDMDFVAYQDTSRTWSLGVATLEVGAGYLRSDPLQVQGQRALTELTSRMGLTSHLAVLQHTDVLYIGKQDAPGNGVKLVTEVGTRLPAHLTSVGQAILAHLTPSALTALYDGHTLDQVTGAGPRTLAELLTQLEKVRANGHALDTGMITMGISCLAAPILRHDGQPAAAIGVTYLTAQLGPDQVEDAIAAVRSAGRQLSAALGYRSR